MEEDKKNIKKGPQLKKREYNGVTYVQVKQRLFLQSDKAKADSPKAPDYKNANSAAWYANGETWQAIDTTLELPVEEMIEYLKGEGLI
jgi:hypothetical protein